MSSLIPAGLFSLFVSTSWRAAWLIVVLIVVRRLVRGRIPAQVWFTAWLIVALRLLLPFSIPVGWSPYNLTLAAPKPPVIATLAPAPVVSETEIAVPPAPGPDVLPPAVSRTEKPAAIAVSAPPRRPAIDWPGLAAVVWIAGVMLIATVRLLAAGWFRRQLARATPLADGRVAALVADELKHHGRGARIGCFETDAVDAPALYGIVRPRLLFPPDFARQFNDEELRLVVRHELAHWRRRDLLAQALLQVAVTVHWFNPLAWFAARLARVDCELACDEFVLRRESHDGSGAYGATLLKVLGVVRGRRRPGTVVAIIEGRQQLAQRVRMIADYRGSTVARVVCGVALVAALAAASLTRESHAAAAVASVAAPAATSNAAVSEPAPAGGHAPVRGDIPTYTLRPGDRIRVQVFQHPELTCDVLLPASGAVQLPLVGEVALSERSVAEAQEIVRNGYATVKEPKIDDPQVRIAILNYAPRRSVVDGAPPKFADSPLSDGRVIASQDSGTERSQHSFHLNDLIAAQQRKVEQLARELQEFKEKNRVADMDTRRDLITANLKASNADLFEALRASSEVAVQVQQVEAAQGDREALAALPFIASQPSVMECQRQLAGGKSELAALAERYRAAHPAIEQARAMVTRTEKQLDDAIDQARSTLVAGQAVARKRFEAAKSRFDQLVQDSLEFDRVASACSEKARELAAQTQVLQNLVARQSELAIASTPVAVAPAPAAETAPAGEFTVSVMGAVRQPGVITFARNESPVLLDVIARVGGFTEKANRRAIRIVRTNTDGSRTVEERSFAEEKPTDLFGSLASMRRGDIVVVAELPVEEPTRVSIFGQVNNPGQYVVPAGEKLTLVGLLARAGGPTRLANLLAVTVRRVGKDGLVQVFTVNVKTMISGGSSDTWPLETGDIVSVPERVL